MSSYAEIQADIAKARELENRAAALERLKASPDFRLIFTEGLFKEEMTNCVLRLHKAKPEEKELLAGKLSAISFLASHLDMISARGKHAHQSIIEGLRLLDEFDEE